MEHDVLSRGCKPRDAMRVLRAAGFVEVRNTGDHHIFRHPTGVRVCVQDSLKVSAGTWKRNLTFMRKALREVERRGAAG